MAAASKDSLLPSLPALNIGSVDNSEKANKGSPGQVPSRAAQLAPSQQPASSLAQSQTLHRVLTQDEWAKVAHGIGAVSNSETNAVVHPTCWYYPAKGLPDGLYRDVVFERSKNLAYYHTVATLRWIFMICQIILGAVLTALGSMALKDGTPITVLAALNTIDAGLLALMHNSGVPDRFRLNQVEFSKVEDFLRELLETGIVEAGQTADEVLASCFDKFQAAKATVQANLPSSYVSQTSGRPQSRILGPDSSS